MCKSQHDWLSGADVCLVFSWCSTLKFPDSSMIIVYNILYIYKYSNQIHFYYQTKPKCHKHLYPQEMSVHVYVVLLLLTLLLTLSDLCICWHPPHVFGFHYYLIAANKQFMPLNWGNKLYPDTRLSNHLDFLSLSSSSCGKQNTWRSSTDNTEAHYLLHALYGSFEMRKVQRGLSLSLTRY